LQTRLKRIQNVFHNRHLLPTDRNTTAKVKTERPIQWNTPDVTLESSKW